MVVGFEEMLKTRGGQQLLSLHPLVLELNRLQNQLKEKERELGVAMCEIKALRATASLKDKAIEDLRNEVNKLDQKLDATENVLEHKNLEILKLTNEKKEALADQYAAEAALRRVHESQKDDDKIPIESIISPLEAEIKMYRNEITAMQEDKKAMERLTKSKESALLEAERILKAALERALIVEVVQNQNFELRRQIEICQEENKILEMTNHQKVLDVERLSQTIQELEEAILAGGAVANTIRDYQRIISELQEEKRTLERELARVKVSVNRVAAVVANEWKDENDKVMPVKQWLEERRVWQAETQRLRDKLAVLDRTAKAETQLKEKLKLRLGTVEEGLKKASNFTMLYDSPKAKKSHSILGFLTSSSGKENAEIKANRDIGAAAEPKEIKCNRGSKEERQNKDNINPSSEDIVSGFLYDRLQKEVIALRKLCQVKDSNLNCKDEEITMLVKKVETLTKERSNTKRKGSYTGKS